MKANWQWYIFASDILFYRFFLFHAVLRSGPSMTNFRRIQLYNENVRRAAVKKMIIPNLNDILQDGVFDEKLQFHINENCLVIMTIFEGALVFSHFIRIFYTKFHRALSLGALCGKQVTCKICEFGTHYFTFFLWRFIFVCFQDVFFRTDYNLLYDCYDESHD